MSEKQQKVYAKGIFANTANNDFVIAKLSFKVEDAIAFLQANKNEKGYCNIDILKGKDKDGQSKPYAVLNDWKPTGDYKPKNQTNAFQKPDLSGTAESDGLPF
jgi:hypothetical protein